MFHIQLEKFQDSYFPKSHDFILPLTTWHSGTKYEKITWSCVTAIKKGKKNCPHSKSIAEKDLESTFIDAFNLMISKNKQITEEFIKNVETTLSNSGTIKKLKEIEIKTSEIEKKIDNLMNLYLEGTLRKENFEAKYAELSNELEKVKVREKELQSIVNEEGDLKNRIAAFRKLFEDNKFLEEFDREIFETVIDKILVGKIDEEGVVNPYSITFVFKTSLEIEKKDIDNNLYLHSTHDTCEVHSRNAKERYVEILEFRHFVKYIVFTGEGEMCRNKHIKDYVTVKVVIDVGCGNTRN